MQRILSIFCFFLTVAAIHAQEQQAEMKLFRRGLRFDPAFIGFGGESQLVLGTAPGNGEVLPSRSVFDLESAFLLDTPDVLIGGTIEFDLPAFSDMNENAADDFYEVSEKVEETQAAGRYATWDQYETGTVSITWSRNADSHFGSAIIQMVSDKTGPFPEFTHRFELLEYLGTLAYTVGEENVSGEVFLNRSDNSSFTLQGDMFFSEGPFPVQDLFFGSATEFLDESNQSMTLSVASFLLDRAGMNYFSDIEFNDGDLDSEVVDFKAWGLIITDPNDADGDGIPDLSDREITMTPILPPELTIRISEETIEIQINGEAGQNYSLESSPDAYPASWGLQQTVFMESGDETVTFEMSDNSQKFWRVLTQ